MSYNYSEFKKKKKDNFNPCVPPDDNPVPSGMIKDITRTGSEDFIHEYKNINGEICFYIKKSQDRSGKQFTPMSYCPEKKTWVAKAWPGERPLFREQRLKGSDKPVLITEGEKSVMAAEDKLEFEKYNIVSWSGGSNQVHLTNYQYLKDKEVILWPDNDDAGIKAMVEVAIILLEKDITEKIKIINPDPMDMMPKGWDIADHFPEEVENEGLTLGGMLNTAKEFEPENYKKLINKIKETWEQREAKEQLEKISEQYIYVRALDEFYELKTRDFVKATTLNNWWAHKFKNKLGRGNVADRLLANPETKKVLNYIKLAKRDPGVIDVSTKDNPLITPGKYLNIYNPHNFELKKGDITPFIKFYAEFLGPEQFKHLDRYLAGYFQLRGEKFSNSPVIVSPEGGGKGILAEEFLAPGLGFKNVATNVSYQNVISKHSTIVRDFSLVVINEVVILKQHGEKVEISNALKSLITDKFIVIDEKNKPIINILNTTNFIIFSNSKQCLHLENSARRYCILYSPKTKEDFEVMDKRGDFEEFVSWARNGGAQFVAHYYTNERTLTDEDKKFLYGRAAKTDALEELIKDSRHPTIKKLEDRFEDEAEPFTKDWVGFISKSQLITWVEENIRGHAPDNEIEQWLKEKAIPWRNGDLTRRVLTEKEGRPRVYLLKDRPKEMQDGTYLDWTEGELGFAPTTGTIALSNNAGPMKWNDDEQKDPTKRAYNLARQVEHMPKEVFDMVVAYKKIQNRALKKIKSLEKEWGPNVLDERVIINTTQDENGKTSHTYSTKRAQLQEAIKEQFIKEYASVFIHEKSSPDYAGDNRGPEYLGKKRPPNITIDVRNGHLEWEWTNRKTRELVRHGDKELDL